MPGFRHLMQRNKIVALAQIHCDISVGNLVTPKGAFGQAADNLVVTGDTLDEQQLDARASGDSRCFRAKFGQPEGRVENYSRGASRQALGLVQQRAICSARKVGRVGIRRIGACQPICRSHAGQPLADFIRSYALEAKPSASAA
jgi:hypothetical protein